MGASGEATTGGEQPVSPAPAPATPPRPTQDQARALRDGRSDAPSAPQAHPVASGCRRLPLVTLPSSSRSLSLRRCSPLGPLPVPGSARGAEGCPRAYGRTVPRARGRAWLRWGQALAEPRSGQGRTSKGVIGE